MAAAGQPGNEVGFYIAAYGEIRPEQDSQVAKAHEVFARVRAVADKNGKRLRPELVVVNSDREPWAIAIPDGHIVLSKKAVALCYQNATPAEAEARLAFVLGHELAHLANDDFWHQEVNRFLADHSGNSEINRFLRDSGQARERELAADDRGFVYAAMAGYPVDSLLQPHSGVASFFALWMQQTHTRVQSSHPEPERRAALLRRRLDELREKLGFFEISVRLGHFGYCDDAVYLLKKFQEVFPSREVLNDIGYCYLQMAREKMDPERAYFYWMPLLLDGETRAGAVVGRGGPALKSLRQAASDEARDLLESAVIYLQRAAQADPGYIPARLNLAVAYLYLGRASHAQAALSEAHAIAPDDLAIQGLRALARYEQSAADFDLWPTAVAALEKLVDRADAPPSLRFNLARLLAVRSRDSDAGRHWNRLAKMAGQLPDPIQAVVCRQQSAMSAQACNSSEVRPGAAPPWQWPLRVNGFTRLSSTLRRVLADWETVSFDGYQGKMNGRIYQRRDGKAAVLELDRFVQLQVLRGGRLGSTGRLQAYCSRSLRQRPLVQGVVWSCYDWAALALGDEVREVWWVAR